MSNSNSVLTIAVIGVLALIGNEAYAGQPASSAQTRQTVQRTPIQKKTPVQQAALRPMQPLTRQSPVVRQQPASALGTWQKVQGLDPANQSPGSYSKTVTFTLSTTNPAPPAAETLDIAHKGVLDEKPSAAEDTGPKRESISFVHERIVFPVQDTNAAASATDDLESTKSDRRGRISELAANGQKKKKGGSDIAVEGITLSHEGMEKPAKEIDPGSVAWVSGTGGTRN